MNNTAKERDCDKVNKNSIIKRNNNQKVDNDPKTVDKNMLSDDDLEKLQQSLEHPKNRVIKCIDQKNDVITFYADE